MTLPLVPIHAEETGQGKGRHETSSRPWPHPRPHPWPHPTRLHRLARRTPSGFRSPESQTECDVQVSQVCSLVCMCQRVAWSAPLAPIMQALPPRAIWEVSSEQSFKHVHRPYQLPTCRPACAVTSLFGCESLRSTPLETCLSVLQVHYLDYRRVSELHYLGTSGPCLYCWNLRQGWNYPFTSYCPECSDCSTMSLIGICSTYPLFYCLCCLKCAHCTLCSSHTYVTVIVHWWLAHCLDFAV